MPLGRLDAEARPRQESTQVATVISDVAALTVRANSPSGFDSYPFLLLSM
jgi:hypothetical protein